MAQAFNFIRINEKSESIPEYLRDLTLAEIANYYFNWNPHQEQAPWDDIKAWFKKNRGWTWK